MEGNVLAEAVSNSTDGTSAKTPASETTSPDKTEQQTGEIAENQTPSTKHDVPKGVIKEIVSLREKNRERQKTIDELNAKISELETKPAENLSLLDDPDKFLKQREEKLIKETEERIMGRLTKEQQDKEFQLKITESAKFLLSQEDVAKDPGAVEELKDILNDEELTRVTSVSPKTSAEIALKRWRESKGINKNTTENASRSASIASASLGGGSGAKKVYTMSEFLAETKKLDHKDPNFKANWQSLMDAQKEGRIR